MNKIVKLTVLDHDHEYDVEPKNYPPSNREVEIYGKILYEDKETIVLGNWTSATSSDVYRVLKNCIIKKRYLK